MWDGRFARYMDGQVGATDHWSGERAWVRQGGFSKGACVVRRVSFSGQQIPRIGIDGLVSRCDAFPAHDDAIQEGQFLSTEEAAKQIQGSEYACPEVGIDGTDPLQFKGGEQVSVEMTDATPGHHPQEGKLVGLNASRVVLQLETGLRVHFPRIGYAVKRAR